MGGCSGETEGGEGAGEGAGERAEGGGGPWEGLWQ